MSRIPLVKRGFFYATIVSMVYIIGLGNPGEEYEGSRHNTGRDFLFYIAKKRKFSEWKTDAKLKSLSSKGEIAGVKVVLIAPETFMNNSGNAIRGLELSAKALEKMIVCYDDLDLGLGTLKLSFNRGPGGHNGVASIIKAVKSEAFPRIRIGVSPATPKGKVKKPTGEEKVVKFLMGEFRPNEKEVIKKSYKKADEALEVLVGDSRQKAMTLFN